MKNIDITGKKFGRLTVLYENGRRGKNIIWRCKCECGKEIDAIAYNLKNGHIKSCGCVANEVKSIVHSLHGGSKTPLFRTWQHMLNRCRNSNVVGYKNYGGRGITVCKVHDFNPDAKDAFLVFKREEQEQMFGKFLMDSIRAKMDCDLCSKARMDIKITTIED